MQLLEGHDGPINAIQFSANGEWLASAGKDGSVRCWNSWGEFTELSRSKAPANVLAFSGDNRYLAHDGDDQGGLQIWDLSLSRKVDGESGLGRVSGLAFFPDDQTIVYSLTALMNTEWLNAGFLAFSDLSGERKTVRGPSIEHRPTASVSVLAVNRHEKLMAWVSQRVMTVWPITTSTTTRFSLKNPCRSLAISPDGRNIAAAIDWKVAVFDVQRKQERFTLVGHKGVVSSVVYSPDGRYLLTGSWDKSIRFWDAESGREVSSFSWPVGRVSSIAFAPDGLRAAAAGDEGKIVVWDVDG